MVRLRVKIHNASLAGTGWLEVVRGVNENRIELHRDDLHLRFGKFCPETEGGVFHYPDSERRLRFVHVECIKSPIAAGTKLSFYILLLFGAEENVYKMSLVFARLCFYFL